MTVLPANTPLLLEVDSLSAEFRSARGWTAVVENVSFHVQRSRVVGIVGESGSGKTVTSLAILGLLGYRGGRVPRGSIRYQGVDLLELDSQTLSNLRGDQIGAIFQQPILALNPAYTVGDQIAETVRRHLGLSRKESWARAVEMLSRVEISDANRRAREYPHMFSGGMCQRVMIAQALSCNPALLIADEPTTALDVTIQASILQLLRDIEAETGIGVLLITHDLAVIAEMADEIVVMYAGQVVEAGPALDLITRPRHPYTEALIGAVPTGKAESLVTVPGTAPTPGHMPTGCRFAPRCEAAVAGRCDSGEPELRALEHGRLSRCIRAEELYGSTNRLAEHTT